MKKILFSLTLNLIALCSFSQWIAVGTGLSDFPPVSMYAFMDTIYLGQDGGGIFRTTDNGIVWQNVSGNLPNLNIHDVRPGPASSIVFAATANGPFFTSDLTNYQNCATPGLTQPNINYFWFGGDDPAEWAIGSNGGGIFTATDYFGPWIASSNGISGAGFTINDMGGYSDVSINYSVIATDGGVYFSNDNLSTWTKKNNGLAGDALLVTKVTGLGSMVIIATRGGLFMTTDGGDTWTPMIPGEALNTVFIIQSPLSYTGFFLFAFGVNGFYTEDFISFTPVDLDGLPAGEITAATVNSTNMFLGVTGIGKSGGSIYRKPLDLVVATEENPSKKLTSSLSLTISPNPFTGQTLFTCRVENPGTITLTLLNQLGQTIQTIEQHYSTRGVYTFSFIPGSIDPGIYLVNMLENGILKSSRKMIYLR